MCLRFAGRLAALSFVALTTANCAGPVATAPVKTGNKYGVAASPKVIPDGQPIPKGGGREMVGKPYVVGERTYVPHDGKGYAREGEASWYGTAFHGRLTANGEVFDKESIAAAHPTLPLPSYVRVTNLKNRRSMIVRVNDRGPYERGRLIDLSERAADALEFHRAGTTKVRVEYVGRASVKGSDDRKLLATLRTDGGSSGMGHARGPVMLASLDQGGPNAQPLAFKPPEPKAAPNHRDPDEAEDATPAPRPEPVVVASRNLGPTPRLQNLVPQRAEPHVSPQLAHALAAHAPVPGSGPTRLAAASAKSEGPPLAKARPAPVGSAPRVAASGLHLVDAKSLPPARPAITNLYAETGRKHVVKAAEKAEPPARPGRQRVVSLKAGPEAALR